jgi:hypothetical protein
VQVMETCKTKLGADHPSTLTTMNNLAFTWKGQGRDAEALRLMEDCVPRLKRVFGIQHPHFLSSYATLSKWEAYMSFPHREQCGDSLTQRIVVERVQVMLGGGYGMS